MDIEKTFTGSSVLFPILTLYSIVYLGLMIYDFVAKGTIKQVGELKATHYVLAEGK